MTSTTTSVPELSLGFGNDSLIAYCLLFALVFRNYKCEQSEGRCCPVIALLCIELLQFPHCRPIPEFPLISLTHHSVLYACIVELNSIDMPFLCKVPVTEAKELLRFFVLLTLLARKCELYSVNRTLSIQRCQLIIWN